SCKFDGGEVLSEGRYAVAPPSIHRGGTAYTWLKEPADLALNEIPATFLDFIETSPKARRVSSRSLTLRKEEARHKPKYGDTHDTRLAQRSGTLGETWVEYFEDERAVAKIAQSLGITSVA